jgi:phosphoserine phosphatase RsbU/P
MDLYLIKLYERLLESYLKQPKEDYLYSAQQLAKWLIQERVPPEEVLGVHISALKKLVPRLSDKVKASFDLLIEVMIGYGVAYQETERLVQRQRELENEIEVAVGLQQRLLPMGPPPLEGVDIGVISVASKQMSGDYYNFVDHGQKSLGVAVSDIIGKGVPAALCMSMIKYAMDRFDEQPLSPSEVLRGLNTVVWRNVDPGMFITMVYGVYDSLNHRFSYATAGHEPGLIWRAAEDRFFDLETKGLVLGIQRDVDYPEFVLELDPNDAVVLFTDGVTECRVNGRFLQRDTLKQLIRDQIHLPAQQAVEAIHQRLYELAGYQMRDDQTILIIKRTE